MSSDYCEMSSTVASEYPSLLRPQAHRQWELIIGPLSAHVCSLIIVAIQRPWVLHLLRTEMGLGRYETLFCYALQAVGSASRAGFLYRST